MGQGYREAEGDVGAKETEMAEGAEGAERSKGPRWLTRLIWIWTEFGLFRAKNPNFYGRNQKFCYPHNIKPPR